MNRFSGLSVCFAVSLCTVFAAGKESTAKVTYNRHIAPILNQRCVECHRKGEIAPMAFTSYKEVRPWAKAIRERVVARTMPPWLADPHFGKFANDRSMTQAEIDAIIAWVKDGAPEGDSRGAPPAPAFTEGWQIGKPDVIISLLADNEVPADGVVPYQYYKVPTNFTEDKWVEAAEVRPGNRSLVHHVIIFIQEPGGNKTDNGVRDALLTGYAPGEQPMQFQPGTAKLIRAGSTFNFQMHYTPNGKAGKDRTYVGLRFANQPPQYRAYTGNAMNMGFKIPAGADNHEVKSVYTAKQDIRLLGFMPHMHLRGKDFKYTISYPDGRSETALSVPKYDFNWQLGYTLAEPLTLPKGTRIDCVAHFDNSANNKYNPDPTKEVKWGDQTWEEMMIGWFTFTLAEPMKPATQTGGQD